MEQNLQWTGGIDQKKKSGSRSSSTQSARRAPAMTLSASSTGLKELAGLPPKPGVNVDGGKRLVGALAPGIVLLEPPAMELHVNAYTCQF
ncbi:hypothetical protein D1007_10725 [Hordeum vulgare]|nr:hypothetical protein D1007_10725 [Hordeum vulgare]